MERYAALMNAQNVWAWATFFGHGDIVGLTKYTHCVQLEIHFPCDKYIKEREDEKIRNVTVAGADFRWKELSEHKIDILYITWRFD